MTDFALRLSCLLLAVALVLGIPATDAWGQGTQLAGPLPEGASVSSVIPFIDDTPHQIAALMKRAPLTAEKVTVIDLSRQVTAEEAYALARAAARNRQALGDLRVALDNHPGVKDQLAAHDISLDQVIGLHAGRTVVIYAYP